MKDELLEIEKYIKSVGPVSVKEIGEFFKELTPPQLKYRLRMLRDSNRIKTVGARRWLKYYVDIPTAKARIDDKAPVGFVDLVEDYTPNESAYLTREERSRLHTMGKSEEALPAGTYARDVHERILIDLSWASSKLDGSTFSLLDTKYLFETMQRVKGASQRDAQMILNHKRAIEFILENHQLSEILIRNLHATLVDGLIRDPRDSGSLRKRAVFIHASVFVPLDNPHKIVELFTKIIEKAKSIRDVFERSFFLLLHLPYLQPFVDGNKRTARLSCNIPLINGHYKPITFINISKEEYIAATITYYETHDYSPLKAIYLSAYEASIARFREVEKRSIQPNIFRMTHRKAIYDTVALIVRGGDAKKLIRAASKDFEQEVQQKFSEYLYKELDIIHEGNFMRYHITPKEFEEWKRG